jgi:GNAT superfamily N-acetyltransferase
MTQESEFIDRNGMLLRFSQERSQGMVYLRWENEKTFVAYAYCRFEGEVLFVTDLCVRDDLVNRQRNYFKKFFGPKTNNLDFREQGLGTLLLSAIVAFAKSEGFKRIEGRIVKKDTTPNPNLPKWYQKRGFTVEESLVSMDLTKPSA